MGRAAVVAKTWIQRLFHRAGYRVERLIQPVNPVDVFDLAVRKTASERGNDFFFVQIGALDGTTLDPIRRYVVEYQWAGLLVEPQPAMFAHLTANYAGCPRLRFANVAVAREDGNATLYTVSAEGLPREMSGMASFDRTLLAKQIPTGTPIIPIQIPTVTLDNLLRAHAVPRVDLLQLDTEGYDFEILKLVNFETIRPSVIHYEHRHLSDPDRTACERLLAGHGYRLHATAGDTTAVIQG